MPATNQAFRELAAGRQLLRGFNELTLGELASGDAARLMRVMSGGVTVERLALEFHFRLALAFAPLALAMFSLGAKAAQRRVHGVITTVVAAFVVCFGYYTLLNVARQAIYRDSLLSAAPAWMQWMPNLLVVVIAMLLVSPASRRRAGGVPAMNRPGRTSSCDRGAPRSIRSTLERLIDPAIADLQCEHAEAVRHGRLWRARWVRVASGIAFCKVAALAVFASHRHGARAIVVALSAAALLTALAICVRAGRHCRDDPHPAETWCGWSSISCRKRSRSACRSAWRWACSSGSAAKARTRQQEARRCG